MSAPTPSGKTTAVVLAPALRTWRSLLTSPFPPAAFGSEGHTVSPWNSENPTGMMQELEKYLNQQMWRLCHQSLSEVQDPSVLK
eukprot:CAMPEP_0195032922 /NCGR_PEP_ID=MMETSP0326_2-20130528/64493_1 /TAXON_ID=2866 ORGANISM="Crypthecodinium cohnii, Strain Seligo" /NCGR_SAMPLE_ID=MMETSP0326_2 /ASSEMBLY_ACC=CAM_ASM_000348 /LENGTH=83 /DNA_ID=CAMNT_0040057197 /DNA_START=134 /DNA_END=383 /DNA_ORIENTATION=-